VRVEQSCIHLAFATNEAYAPGLVVSACTAALHCPSDRPLQIHVLDGGIEPASWQLLSRALHKCHPGVVLQRYPLHSSGIWQIRDHGAGRELVYARLLIPNLIQASRVLYLDVDLLVMGNLAPLFDQPLGSNLAAACVDPIVQVLSADQPYPDAPAGDPQSEVGAFYWTVPAPDIVNSGREEQGSVSV
jgi:lipopolysaccharide biosynthesis glycosyltransferase